MNQVRYISAGDLDVDKWDACVHSDPEPLIYNTSWYLDTLGDDWDGLVFGDYLAVMPVVHGKKWRQTYVYRPFGVQQQGISGQGADDAQLVYSFLEVLTSKYRYCEVYLNHTNPSERLPKHWSDSEKVNLVLPISGSYENLYENFSKNTKRNIKKAKKHKFTVFEHDPPDVLIRLFQENQGKKYKVDDDFFRVMRHLMHVLLHKRRAVLWTLHDERNSPVAGIFVVEYKGRATLLFSAMDDYGREHGAMAHLINEYLVMASGHVILFDFEGSNEPGLERFYKGFGAVHRNYSFLKYNRLPLPFRWFK
ncbi:MAG: GNAT family N-acetyltransferase [Flavobacteriia bacterium]|nr:GNAT family N-acetyltransferase [Flavobacteriia bacterium]